MPIEKKIRESFDETSLEIPKQFEERRKKSRTRDTFYQIVVAMNIIAWLLLIASLMLLHYARPEFIAGVQIYWGIEGREIWSKEHLDDLLTLLQLCLFTTIFTLALRSKRNRRKSDRFGINVLILLVISITSLVTLYMAT
jgi:nitric oxide reductase large subunit